jgi:hypothetical protein
MKTMAKYPGLMQRGSRWYLRAKVPADLVEEVGRREIWRSLDTGSHRKAIGRYHHRCGARSRRCSRPPAGACARLRGEAAGRVFGTMFVGSTEEAGGPGGTRLALADLVEEFMGEPQQAALAAA